MTKQQYETFGNDQFLTDEEKEKMKELNCKSEYCLSKGQMTALMRRHRTARRKEEYREMALIEYRLTDTNFHAFCGFLCNGDYKSARDVVRHIFCKE